MSKKILSVILTIVMCLSMVASLGVSVSAVSWPTTSNIKTYVISTGNDTTVYKTATSTTKYGTIYASDLITIKGYSGSRLKVTYPISGGTKTGYIEKSKVTSGTINVATKTWTATSKMTAYRRSSGSATIGSVASGDFCYSIAEKGSRTQIIYPISGGWKMGWVNTSEISGPITEPKQENTSGMVSPVPKGCYFNKKTIDCGGSNWYGYHDININVTSKTPVYAIADGTVTYTQRYTKENGKNYLVSYGNYITFTSSNKKYTAKYCHLSKFVGNSKDIVVPSSQTKQRSYSECKNVKEEHLGTKKVKKGEIIGYIGTTGNSTGIHLHFELKENNSRIDPTSVFPELKK